MIAYPEQRKSTEHKTAYKENKIPNCNPKKQLEAKMKLTRTALLNLLVIVLAHVLVESLSSDFYYSSEQACILERGKQYWKNYLSNNMTGLNIVIGMVSQTTSQNATQIGHTDCYNFPSFIQVPDAAPPNMAAILRNVKAKVFYTLTMVLIRSLKRGTCKCCHFAFTFVESLGIPRLLGLVTNFFEKTRFVGKQIIKEHGYLWKFFEYDVGYALKEGINLCLYIAAYFGIPFVWIFLLKKLNAPHKTINQTGHQDIENIKNCYLNIQELGRIVDSSSNTLDTMMDLLKKMAEWIIQRQAQEDIRECEMLEKLEASKLILQQQYMTIHEKREYIESIIIQHSEAYDTALNNIITTGENLEERIKNLEAKSEETSEFRRKHHQMIVTMQQLCNTARN